MNDYNIDMAEFIDIVKSKLPEDSIKVIFEVGALDGKDSMLFKESFPKSNVYSFEGLPDIYDKFLKNLSGISTYSKVVFNFDGEVPYHKKDVNGIHGVFDRGSSYGSEVLKLPCCRLDTVCREIGVSKIDMIKIDVEGATLEVLEGCGDILNTIKIMHIETEDYEFFKGQKLDCEVNNFLESRGFNLFLKRGYPILAGKFQYDSIWTNI